ncbi:tetratricopeptide repeat protein [Kordiimonas aquimaris]|uniref:tetratricopeptide repeat protein n=1 Tax=Kordiimonas aquimaris TaxID=707591 RepID=UPI0021CEF719|nr:tetratricopeptide repeat protein [Kordiimonas aquimaris]
MSLSIRTISLFVAFSFVAACSDTDDNDQVIEADLPILSAEELNALFAAGDFADLIAAVKRKEQKEVATYSDHILATRAYHATFDAIGASVQLSKVNEALRDSDEYTLLNARTLLLEGNLGRASGMLLAREFADANIYEAKLMQGDIAFLRGDFENALTHYGAAIANNSDNYSAFIARAQAHLKTGNPELALADAEVAVGLSAENTLAHYTLGTAYNQLGRQTDAKAQFEQALAFLDSNVPALLELTGIHIIEGDYETAEQYLDRVYSEQPENSTAQFFSAMLLAVKGDDEKARDQLELLVINNNANPQLARLLGHVAYRLKEYDVARGRLEMVVEKAPFDRASRIALAEIHLLQQRPRRALTTLEPMIVDESIDLAAFSMAGLAAAQVGDTAGAIEYTAKTIALAESPETLANTGISADNIDENSIKILKRRLASFYASAGNTPQAADILQGLITEDAEDITSVTMLSNVQVQAGDFEAALATARLMVDQAPSSPVGHNALGTVLHRQGQLDAALEAYTKAISLNANYVSALKNRGALYLRQQKYTEARADLNIVLDTIPSDARAQLMYVRALIDTDGATEALGYFRNLEGVFPESIQVFMHHARALAAAGDYQRAIPKLEVAQSLNRNNNPELKAYLDGLWTQYTNTLEEERASRRLPDPVEAEESDDAEKPGAPASSSAADATVPSKDAEPDAPEDDKPDIL